MVLRWFASLCVSRDGRELMELGSFSYLVSPTGHLWFHKKRLWRPASRQSRRDRKPQLSVFSFACTRFRTCLVRHRNSNSPPFGRMNLETWQSKIIPERRQQAAEIGKGASDYSQLSANWGFVRSPPVSFYPSYCQHRQQPVLSWLLVAGTWRLRIHLPIVSLAPSLYKIV
jgi:hypothetical protein